jgi:hypothetical protein
MSGVLNKLNKLYEQLVVLGEHTLPHTVTKSIEWDNITLVLLAFKNKTISGFICNQAKNSALVLTKQYPNNFEYFALVATLADSIHEFIRCHSVNF